MVKTNTVPKFVNGEIADADPVNQAIENVGGEGGLIPYKDEGNIRDTTGQQSLGSTIYPWGSFFVNEDATFNEMDTGTGTVSAQVAFSNLRRFLTLKDTFSSFSGFGGFLVRVNAAENALEPVAPSQIETFTPTGSPFTWTAPVGVTRVLLFMGGGGGGGGGRRTDSPQRAGGGGGAGAVIAPHVYKVTPGNDYTLTVGAGGAAGATAASIGGDGGDGGDTIVAGGDYTLTADGGTGGDGGNTTSLGGATGSDATDYPSASDFTPTTAIIAQNSHHLPCGSGAPSTNSNNDGGAGGSTPISKGSQGAENDGSQNSSIAGLSAGGGGQASAGSGGTAGVSSAGGAGFIVFIYSADA